MDESNTPERNKRRHARIRGMYYIKFRPENGNQEWDISPIKNIGTGGIMFQAIGHFPKGSTMNIEICHLLGNSGKICKTSVLRCNKIKSSENLYEVVVDIAQLDGDIKDALNKVMETFLKKRKY